MDITGRTITGMDDVVNASSHNARAIYRYKIPASMAGLARDVATIGLVEITPDEEIMATKRCSNQPIRLAYELSLEAFREIGMAGPLGQDGRPTVVSHRLSTADGTADRVWRQLHPKIRTLVVTAYNELHNPKDGEAQDFLSSREVTTG